MADPVDIAFIGLGVMGFPMAGHLQVAGHRVTVYNRTTARAEQWVDQYGGGRALSPAEAVQGKSIVFSCVGNDDDVRSVLLGEQGAEAGLADNTVLVDHTTTSAELARELAGYFTAKGHAYIDAPVSGGQAGAENAALTVMCGGDQAAYQCVEPVINHYARCVRRLGSSGAGQLAKMVNQICVAGVVQGLAEALHFGSHAGLDMAAVIEVISKGAAQSWQMDNRYQTMLAGEYDFGFAVDWMRKDLGYILQEAQHNGSALPLTALVDEFYRDVQAMGGGRWDTSSLLARLERKKTDA